MSRDYGPDLGILALYLSVIIAGISLLVSDFFDKRRERKKKEGSLKKGC